jgi:hypothetical protein
MTNSVYDDHVINHAQGAGAHIINQHATQSRLELGLVSQPWIVAGELVTHIATTENGSWSVEHSPLVIPFRLDK